MMSRCGIRQQIRLVRILFSLRLFMVCVCVTGLDTIIASEDYLGVRKKGNPPCNAEDNLRAGLLVIEARFRGSWTKGSSGVRPVIHGPD